MTSYAGVCEDDINEFCMDVMPGLGRLAICLSDQLKEQEKDSYGGARVSSSCARELDKFKQDQSNNINKDLPLGMPFNTQYCRAYSLCFSCVVFSDD